MGAPTYGNLMRCFNLSKVLTQKMHDYSKHPTGEGRTACVHAYEALCASLREAGAQSPPPLDEPMLFPVGGGRK